MFDNLREMSDDSALFQESPEEVRTPKARKPPRRPGKKFLGMSAGQRFLLALLLFMTVVVLGSMCLLITDKIMFF